MCVTETQKKVDDIRKSRGIVVRSSMRGEEEQKGGGLMIIYREGEGKNWNKIENGYADILEVEGKIGDLVSRIILCYFRTGAGEEIDRGNRRLRDFILGRIEQVGGEMGMIVLGDFNGHLGYLGEQRENRTGRLVNEMIEGGNLNLLNIDSRCIGRYTWEGRGSRSVIDLVMVNDRIEKRVIGMEIDESRNRLDISDHSLIEVKIRGGRVEKENRKKWEKVEYHSVGKVELGKYVEKVEQRIREKGVDSIKGLNQVIGEVADVELKKTYNRKVGKGEVKQDPPWVTEEVVREIKERKRLNRLSRNAGEEEVGERYRVEYRKQKEVVKEIIRREMFRYEERKSAEIRDRRDGNRKLWENINELRGVDNKRVKELKIYSNEGVELIGIEKEREVKGFWGEFSRNIRIE